MYPTQPANKFRPLNFARVAQLAERQLSKLNVVGSTPTMRSIKTKDNMADIKVVVDPEDVNKAISEAVMKSIIGEELQKAVKELTSSWKFKEVMEKTVGSEIERLVSFSIREKFDSPEVKAQIKAMVVEKLTDETIMKIASSAFEFMIRSMRQ